MTKSLRERRDVDAWFPEVVFEDLVDVVIKDELFTLEA